jgi:hypothetical protein
LFPLDYIFHIPYFRRQSEEIKSGVGRKSSSGKIAPFQAGEKSGVRSSPAPTKVNQPLEISNMDAPACSQGNLFQYHIA